MAASKRDDFHVHQLWLVCQLITPAPLLSPARTCSPIGSWQLRLLVLQALELLGVGLLQRGVLSDCEARLARRNAKSQMARR